MFQYPADQSPQELLPFAVFSLFALTCFIQLIYYWFIYARLAFYRDRKGYSDEKPPVSVIICAKNEYQNLLRNLPLFLEQDYPEYEVLVVNDASEDGSIDLLNSYAKKYPHLKIFDLERDLNFFTGKKFPLALGIKSARYDLLLLTDADCRPSSREWISRMAGKFSEKTGIVLGYGPFAREGTLLNKIIRYDALMTAMNYLSFSLSGLPYMGVGRNLAYRKELFYQCGGFTSHYCLPSGDDDLFINGISRSKNTRIEISRESHIISRPRKSFITWLRQKKRHYTTAIHYKKRFKFLLSLNYATKLLAIASFVALAILDYNLIISAAAIGFLFITHMILTGFSFSRLGEKDLIALSPIMEAFFLVVYPLIYLSNLISRPDKWT